MGGLIRVAGDIARQENAAITTAAHVTTAKKTARSIEDQVSDEITRHLREYEMTVVEGTRVGRVNGLAVTGSDAGSVLPIMAEVTPAQGASGTVIATGMLKKFTGKDVKNIDIHIQFIGTYMGVEGDSASVSVATAVVSAIEGIPVRQDIAMTGSLSVRGDVLPVGGVTYKIEAAAKAGIHTVLIPRMNLGDVLIEERYKSFVTIIPVDTIDDVLKFALVPENSDGFLTKLKKMAMRSTAMIADAPPVNQTTA
jgi:Lon-like ATP-dependent protease